MLRADKHVALEQIVNAACVNGETKVAWADTSMTDPHLTPEWWIVSSSFSLCSPSTWSSLDHPREYHGNFVPWQQVDVDVLNVVEGAGESDVVAKQRVVVAVDSDTKLHFVAAAAAVVVGSTSDGKNHGQDSENDCYAYAGHIDKRRPMDGSTSADGDEDGERREVAWDTALNGLELPSSVVAQDDSRPWDLLST
jgi:hypothetical protein